MNLLSTVFTALSALWRNKLRAFLTTLGVVIGVAAVIMTVGLGEGAKAQAEANFAAMGTNLLILWPGSSNTGGSRGGAGTLPSLTWDDLKAIQSEISTVRAAAPALRWNGAVVAEGTNWSTTVVGTTPEYFDVRNWSMRLGSRFAQSDVDTGNKVIVLGQTVVEKLFGPDADPVGQTVRVRNIPFVVVAVMASKGQSSQGQDFDDQVFIPVTTFAQKLQGGLRNFIAGMVFIAATSSSTTAKAERDIGALLRDRHHLGPGVDDDFNLRNLAEMQQTMQEQTRIQSLLILAIGAISLVVGGIGIMNIMLVSVTERTREIGLRMAVGAQPMDILLQFLVESLVLAVFGGLVGVALGIGAVTWVSKSFGWPALIRPDSIGIAVGVAALIGLIFGIYPAWKASRLDPIDALRYE